MEAETPVYDGRRWRALPVILTATFMSLFDVFVVNVAAPSIERDLGGASAGLELVLAGYSFTYAVGLVTGGRLGDQFGRRRLFVGGMSVFAVASLLCGLAPNITVLVAGRLLQGLGAAAMVPQVLAMINVGFPPRERPRALAIFGAVVGGGTVAGQIIGGVLLDLNIAGLGWRPIFFVNVPIGIAAVIAARYLIVESRAPRHDPVDLGGVALITLGLGALIAPLVLGRVEGWPLWSWFSFAASPVLLAGFVAWERRVERAGGAPLLRLELLEIPAVVTGLTVAAAFFTFFGGFLLVFTVFLQTDLHESPLNAGLTLAPLGLGFAVASLLGGRLGVRFGGAVVTAGATLSALGLLTLVLTLGTTAPGHGASQLVPALVVTGIGNGLVIPLLVGAVLRGIPLEASGAVAGVLTTTMQLSIALGVSIVGLLFFWRAPVSGIEPATDLSLWATLGLVILAVVVSLRLPRPRKAGSAAPQPQGAAAGGG